LFVRWPERFRIGEKGKTGIGIITRIIRSNLISIGIIRMSFLSSQRLLCSGAVLDLIFALMQSPSSAKVHINKLMKIMNLRINWQLHLDMLRNLLILNAFLLLRHMKEYL